VLAATPSDPSKTMLKTRTAVLNRLVLKRRSIPLF
jgi:hypothetical protein